MIALLPMLAIAGVVFVEQPLEAISVYPGSWQDARYQSWRSTDIDGDGAKDVIMRRSVAFHRNLQFPKADQMPLPDLGDQPEADIWKNEIYVLQKDRIEVLRWSNGQWQRTLSQPIAWPESSEDDRGSKVSFSYHNSSIAGIRHLRFGSRDLSFNAFLHDLNGDGQPEIVRAAADGLHVYAKRDLFYEHAATWNILPPPRPRAAPNVDPDPDTRAAVIPTMEAWSQIVLGDGAVTVLTSVPVGNGRKVFRENIHPIATDASLSVDQTPSASFESPPVRNDVDAVRLNDDAIVDFLAVRFSGETGPPLPVPVIDVEVSTDGGKTFSKAQCTGASPERVLTDYNCDGRLDLITESKRLDEGGLRETLVRGLTSRVVDLHMELRIQDDTGKFPAKASSARRFSITLDKPPANQSTMFLHFLSGKLVSLADVDGDRIADAVVHDRPDSLTVYRGGSAGITGEKLASLPIQAGELFYTVDIDDDGRSDIVVSLSAAKTRYAVYLSRESAP